MSLNYDPNAKAHSITFTKEKVRHIQKSQEYFFIQENLQWLEPSKYLLKLTNKSIAEAKLDRHKISFFDPSEKSTKHSVKKVLSEIDMNYNVYDRFYDRKF